MSNILRAIQLATDLEAMRQPTFTDLQMVRANAGLPLVGEVNIPRLQQTVSQCGDGTGKDCPSCQATLEVIAAYATPEDKEFEPARYYRNG